MFNRFRKLWIVLGVLIIFCPLGLIATGTAFGEWGLDELEEEAGFIPAGLEKMAGLWQHAPLPEYGIAGFDASFMQSAAGYILSALIGAALVVGIMSFFRKIVEE